MAWQCYLVEYRNGLFFKGDKVISWQQLDPGAMWIDEGELFVKLPSDTEWMIDRGRIINEQRAASGKEQRLPQWTRVGTPPNVTASPSINHVGRYHGWLRDGVLSDDIEGRIFKSTT